MKNFNHPPARHPAFSVLLLSLCCFLGSFLCIQNVQAQLSGSYTIGGSDGDYATFSEAVAALATEGISGPVSFNVRPGIYEEQIDIGFPGSSCTNTVSFEGDGSDREQVILQAPDPTSSYTVKVRRKVEGIQFRNMTIKGSQTLIEAEEGTNCFSLENNLLMGESGVLVRAYSKVNEQASHRHHYQDNLFIGGSTGMVKIRDQAYNAVPDLEEGLLVIGNEFKGQSSCGISIGSQTAYQINNNRIEAGSCGIAAAGSKKGKEVNGNIIQVAEGEWAVYFIGGAPESLRRNQIHINIYEYGGSALYIEGTYDGSDGEMVIANNLMKVSYNHSFNDFGWSGMSLISTNANIYHNSIQLGPSYNNKGYVADWSYGTYRVFNNNFSNLSGKSMVSPGAVAMDYNNLYSAGFDLEEWQNQTGFDEHSISVRPDEHTLHPAFAGAGIYLEEVPTDLNGNPRPDPPSIGAIDLDKKNRFTIGGEDGDFASFTEALNFLEHSYGLDSILVKVRPGIYREQLTITTNNFRHITFEGENGDSTEVVLEHSEDYALRITSTSHFTFRHMSIKGKGAVFIKAINDQPANHLTFENNLLQSTSEAAAVATLSTAKEGNSHASVNMLALRNNQIIGEGWGLYKEGSLFYFSYHNMPRLSDNGIELMGNHFITGSGGIFISHTGNISLENNRLLVENASVSFLTKGIQLMSSYEVKKMNGNYVEVRGPRAHGIEINAGIISGIGSSNVPEQFTHNRILLPEGGTGVAFEIVSSGSDDLIANNMVSVKGNEGSVGFLMNEFEFKGDFLFNSIYVYGEDTQSKAFSFGASENHLHLANNIFANTAGGLAIYGHPIGNHGSPLFPTSDYNNLYTSGERLAVWNESEVTSLTEWQALTGLDAYSLSVDPQFESAENLIPSNPALDGAGLALAEVTTDFFGKLRSTPPDIGAVEFDAEAAPEPTAGHITGGGWFPSPAGAYEPDPQVGGRAIFSFNARDKEGEEAPKGNVTFILPEARLVFHSQGIDWLSVHENKAFIKGSGMIGREEGYHFLLSMVDHGQGIHSQNDHLRVIIWDREENIIYDNQRGEARYAQASMAIRQGNIIIHGKQRNGKAVSGRMQEEPVSGELVQGLKAYPTRLSQQGLWLEFPVMDGRKELQLSIYDMQGRKMASKTFVAGEQGGKQLWKPNHQAWSPGIYLLRVEGEELNHKQKLIK